MCSTVRGIRFLYVTDFYILLIEVHHIATCSSINHFHSQPLTVHMHIRVIMIIND